jgi:voltage-gated potassium channel
MVLADRRYHRNPRPDRVRHGPGQLLLEDDGTLVDMAQAARPQWLKGAVFRSSVTTTSRPNSTGVAADAWPLIGGTIVVIALQEGSDVMVRLLVRRRLDAFLRAPLSVRSAMGVIISATLVSVLLGGVLIRVVDPEEFPDLGTGLWWALQTVTTVGYGDVTPENTAGRLVGALFLVEAIAFVTIVTAVITSSFVERARRERIADTETTGAVGAEQLAAQLAEITSRLDRIQQTIDAAGSAGGRPTLG